LHSFYSKNLNDGVKLVKQFQLFHQDTALEYFTLLMEEQSNAVSMMEWFLNFNDQFDQTIDTFYHILTNLVWAGYHCLRSIYCIKIVPMILESLQKLYNFMTSLLKHVSLHDHLFGTDFADKT
jgi:hypothetical protein